MKSPILIGLAALLSWMSSAGAEEHSMSIQSDRLTVSHRDHRFSVAETESGKVFAVITLDGIGLSDADRAAGVTVAMTRESDDLHRVVIRSPASRAVHWSVTFPLTMDRSPDDGYALYTQAFEHFESLGLDRRSPAWLELRAFQEEGGVLSAEAANLLQEGQKSFSLILDADRTPFWGMPDNTTFSVETTFPWISSSMWLNSLTTAKAIKLYLDGAPNDVFTFLAPFNTTGMKVAKHGTLIHFLFHIACRSKHYPVLASSIDNLPEASLPDELTRAIAQYHQIPKITETLAGDQHMAINTVKGLFADLRQHDDLMTSREQMISGLRDLGIDKQALERIEADEALSVSQWETMILSHLRRLQSFYADALSTRPSSELENVDDELEREIDKIGNGVEYEAAMASWILFMASPVADSFSMPEAERLHAHVGKAISHKVLSMSMPFIARFGIRYREYIACERLLLIRIAARQYATRHGERPEMLQQLVDDALLEAEMIIDPLSGELFRITNTAPHEVYGIGRNLVDNGGIPWDQETNSGDLLLVPLERKWRVQQ